MKEALPCSSRQWSLTLEYMLCLFTHLGLWLCFSPICLSDCLLQPHWLSPILAHSPSITSSCNVYDVLGIFPVSMVFIIDIGEIPRVSVHALLSKTPGKLNLQRKSNGPIIFSNLMSFSAKLAHFVEEGWGLKGKEPSMQPYPKVCSIHKHVNICMQHGGVSPLRWDPA